MSRESTNYSLMQKTSSAAGLESTNPSKPTEVGSKILGDLPIFQEGDNVDREGKSYIQEGNSPRMVTGPDFKGVNMEQMREMIVQPSRLELNDGAKCKPAERVLGSEYSRMDQ